MSVSVIAMYENPDQAKKAVNEIVKTGFDQEAIDVISGDRADRALIAKLVSHGIAKDEAELLVQAISGGRALVTLDAANDEDKAEDAREIMDRFGAQDIDELVAEMKQSGQSQGEGHSQSGGEESRESVPVVEEQVSVGTRQVLRGGVRVTSKVSEHPVEETVMLREESVDVDRRQADRTLSPKEAEKAFQEKTIEATETGEEAQVKKEARVTGEVSLRKTAEEREEEVRATARRTDVEVSDIEPQERQKQEKQ